MDSTTQQSAQSYVVLGLVQGVGNQQCDVTWRDALSRNKVNDPRIDLGRLRISTWRLVKLNVITLNVGWGYGSGSC